MTYEEMLDAHVREFDRITARVRAIMLKKNYDNVESTEMKDLRSLFQTSIADTFRLKCCHGHAEFLTARLKKPTP